MSSAAIETLCEFFRRNSEILPLQSPPYFFRAEWHPAFREIFSGGFVAQQTYRPHARILEQQGITICNDAVPLPHTFALTILIPTKQKVESLGLLARAVEALSPRGTVIVCAENHRGAKSYRDALASLCPTTESWSKNRCLVAWAQVGAIDEPLLRQWKIKSAPHPIAGTSHLSQPGVFAWEKIDEGSAFLVEHLPRSLAGRGAVFGAGTGFLSSWILNNAPAVTALDLFEAEQLALSCARQNLAFANARAAYHWCDIVTEPPRGPFDWIVMNPPCHDSRELSTELGIRFIEHARYALRPGGTLYLVGNSHLPYSREMQRLFGNHHALANNGRFNVLRAEVKEG